MSRKFLPYRSEKKEKPTPDQVSKLSPILSENDIFTSLKVLRAKYPTTRSHRQSSNASILKTFDLISSPLHTDKSIFQKISCDRLAKGRTFHESKLMKLEMVHSEARVRLLETQQSAEEEESLQQFINSLRVLKDLKSELSLNYKISRSEVPYSEINLNGLAFSLQDILVSLENNEKLEVEALSVTMHSLNTSVRELIRVMKSKDIDRGAEVMELLWKAVVKLIDNACYSHSFSINILADKAQIEQKEIIEKSQKEIREITERFVLSSQKLIEENQKLQEKIAKLRGKCEVYEEELNDRNQQLDSLFRVENRNNDLKSMNKLLGGMDKFISDTEREQIIQVSALGSIANIMELIKKAGDRHKVSKIIQTEPLDFSDVNYYSKYEDYVSVFGTTFGEIGSSDSINNFVTLIKRDLSPMKSTRFSIKRKTKT